MLQEVSLVWSPMSMSRADLKVKDESRKPLLCCKRSDPIVLSSSSHIALFVSLMLLSGNHTTAWHVKRREWGLASTKLTIVIRDPVFAVPDLCSLSATNRGVSCSLSRFTDLMESARPQPLLELDHIDLQLGELVLGLSLSVMDLVIRIWSSKLFFGDMVVCMIIDDRSYSVESCH